MHEPFTRSQKLFFVLGSVFVTALVVADIIGGAKIAEIGQIGDWPIRFSVGMLAFPVTFVLTDLLNDFYGARATRFLTFVGLGMLILAFVVLMAASSLRAVEKDIYPAGWFDGIFGSSLRAIFASLVAYLVGQLLDIWLFGVLKRLSRGRMLWLRATGSTLLSQWVDTIIVALVLFGGNPFDSSPAGAPRMPYGEIWMIIVNSYIIKFVIAVAMTPVIYAGHGIMHRYFDLHPVPLGSEAGSEARPEANADK